MNTFALLRAIEMVRPQVGNLIRIILEAGAAGDYAPLGVVSPNGEPTLSLRTIARAMEVLDDYTKTKDFWASVPSRAVHAYHVVERAVREQHSGSRSEFAIGPGGPDDAPWNLRSGVYGSPDDPISGSEISSPEPS